MEAVSSAKPGIALGIQSDTAFSEASKRLNGRDLCSISDLSVEEMAAIMELAHAVKSHPGDFRHALDARQMVLFFEKASLRTRLPLKPRSTPWEAMPFLSTKRTPLWASVNH